MMDHVVASTDDLPAGEGMTVEVDGLPIAIFNVEGDYYALSNRCIHKGGPVGEGKLHSELPSIDANRLTVHCPWHYWEYYLETGERVVSGEKGLRTFDVFAEDDNIILRL